MRGHIEWDMDSLVLCPHCGRYNPIPVLVLDSGIRMRQSPYPCDCAGYTAEVERFEQQEEQRKQRSTEPIPKQFQNKAGDVDCEVYADLIIGGKGLYFYGGNGRGKTQIAHDTKVAIESRGRSARVYKAKELITEINESMGEQNALFSRLRRCDLLIIDDLGAESVTESSVLNMQRIIDDRYEDMKPVLITSNYSRGELATRYASVNPVAASAIASRLTQMTVAEELEGEDRRVL